MNGFVRYFNILADVRSANTAKDIAPPAPGAPSVSWLPQWLALVAGVIVQPFFAAYQKNGSWDVHGVWGWLVAAVIIAMVVFPAVYRNAFDPTKPLFIQIIPIFTAGLGWNTLFSAAVHAASGSSTPP